jgi:hypothetical protein
MLDEDDKNMLVYCVECEVQMHDLTHDKVNGK